MKFGGLRTKTTDDRFAVLGSGPGEVEVIEDTPVELDSERYYANGDFRRDITDRFFWVVGAGWLRDLDAGIENRTEVYGGVGNTWRDRDDLEFKTAYTFAYANQQDEIQDPLVSNTSPGIRLSSDLMKRFGTNTTYDNDLVFFFNLDEAEDYHFTWLNSVTSDFSKVFGLRVSLQLLYNNIPALEEIDLYDIDPAEGDASLIGTTVVRKKKLDTVFKVTFVIKI
jgi:putative salt-induced outer membrane protein YdiY